MDREVIKKEMPIPTYAVGIHILLIDPDTISLRQTTSMLEESTFQVTSIEVPDIAITLMKEKTNEFDLIVAAAKMQGIDCLKFIKDLVTLSDIPVVLISNVEDLQLATTTLKHGVSHFLEKPLMRDEVRALWQFVFRKPIIKTKCPNIEQKEDSMKLEKSGKNAPKNKGRAKVTQNVVQSHKRQKLDCGSGDISQSNGQASQLAKKGDETNEGHHNNNKVDHKSEDRIKWNPEQHEKFMKMLTSDTPKGPVLGRQNTQMPHQPPNYLQGPNNNQIIKSTTPKSGIDFLNEQRQLQIQRYQGYGNNVNAKQLQSNSWNSRTMLTPQGPQPQNLINSSHALGNTSNFVNQNNYSQFNPTSLQATSAPYNPALACKTYGNNSMSQAPSPYPPPHVFNSGKSVIGGHPNGTFAGVGDNINKQHAGFGSSEVTFNLRARIDQIRRDYQAKERAVAETKNVSSNEFVSSDQERLMLSDPVLQNPNAKQSNASTGIMIHDLAEGDLHDDISLDEILAELSKDFGAQSEEFGLQDWRC